MSINAGGGLVLNNSSGHVEVADNAYWAFIATNDTTHAIGQGNNQHTAISYDGKLSCIGATIEGTINANAGRFGDWYLGKSYYGIEGGALTYNKDGYYVSLSRDGLEVKLNSGEVEFVTWEQVYRAAFGL